MTGLDPPLIAGIYRCMGCHPKMGTASGHVLPGTSYAYASAGIDSMPIDRLGRPNPKYSSQTQKSPSEFWPL